MAFIVLIVRQVMRVQECLLFITGQLGRMHGSKMKKTAYIILLLLPLAAFTQPGIVLHGDTIGSFDPLTLTWTQLTKLVPTQAGQSGKFLSTNGATYQWVTGLLSNGDGSALTGLTKSQVGLSNVDNTSDVNKPISSATQTALNAKQATLVSATNIKTVNGSSLLGSGDIAISGTAAWGSVTGTLSEQTDLQTALTGKLGTTGDGSNLTGLTKSQVGLANADNTSDANKPILKSIHRILA